MLDPIIREAVIDGGGDGGAAAAVAEPPVSPDALAGLDQAGGGGEPVEPAVPEFGPADLEDVYSDLDSIVDQRVQYALAQILQSQQEPAAAQHQPGVFDWGQLSPFEENFGPMLAQGLAQMIGQAVGQAMAPFQQSAAQAQEQAAQAQAEQNAGDLIASEVSRNGDLPETAKQLIRPLAEQHLPGLIARFGNTYRAHELAVEKAAAQIRQTLTEYGGQAVAQHDNRLGALAGARGEPGAAVTGPLVAGAPIRIMQPGEIARKYATQA